jgi:hypothetical protein
VTTGTKAAALFVALLALYNANGREIASYDSQPAKLAARELLQRGTLTLNYVVGTTPQLLERAPFVAAADGNYRSAYSPAPSLLAAALAFPFYSSGVVDIRAPLAASLIAKGAASILAATASVLLFLAAAHWTSTTRALWIAVALGLGTGYWTTISQTLWQHESAALGLAAAVWAFARPAELTARTAMLFGTGLGLAGVSRAQLSVAIAVLLVGAFAASPRRFAMLGGAIAGAFAAALIAVNLRWFGHALGAVPLLESLHPSIHATEGSFRPSISGLAGLLVSPNRGLLIYSPIVLVALAGIPAALRRGRRSPIFWCAVAAVGQYTFYGSYTVWWGGHTYGPRYALDLLPLLVPVAAAFVAAIRITPLERVLASAALAWSVLVAATGAFNYPNERWNVDPRDVDRSHERLWDWSDLQIVRCWTRGPDPMNFRLLSRAATRYQPPAEQ